MHVALQACAYLQLGYRQYYIFYSHIIEYRLFIFYYETCVEFLPSLNVCTKLKAANEVNKMQEPFKGI